MRRKLPIVPLLGLVALLTVWPASAQPPALTAKPVTVAAPNVAGGKVVLAGHRDQLRVGPGTKTARLHPSVRAGVKSGAIPVPASWDWTRGDTIKLPILGNNRYGDCYEVAPLHIFQLYAGLQGTPVVFDEAAVIRRYLQLSGGDNGLDDAVVFPEVKAGMIGPSGPHKMLDVLVVPNTDTTLMDLTNFAFGPQMFTFTVYSNFMSVGPGTVLDGNTGGIQGGHAIVISGKKANGHRKGETWGIQPSIEMTDKWIRGVEPETISCFSLEWFDKKGYAPNGLHYNECAALWNSMGGHVPTKGPFPDPTPTPTPIPVPPPAPTPPTTVYVGPDQDVVMLLYDSAGKVVGSTRLTKGSIVLHPRPGAAPTLSLDVVFALFALYQDVKASGNGTLITDWNAMMAAIKARKGMLPAIEKFALDLVAAGTNPKVLADLQRLAADLGIPIPFNSPLKTGKPYPKGSAALPRAVLPAFALAF